jgi:nucleotide-binding universal stress UspA family protein
MAIRKVVLATDGSPNADSGLEILVSGPWAPDTSLEVVTVADKIAGVGHLNLAEANALAQATIEQAKTIDGSKRVETTVLEGHAVDLILKFVQSKQADLLIIGSHSKHHPVETLLVGNVAEKLANKSQTSVLIARANKSKLQKILICLESGETAAKMIETTGSLNWTDDTEFLLLHVFQPPLNEYGPSPAQDMRFFCEGETKARAQSEIFLSESASALRGMRPHNLVMTMLLEDFFIAPQIIDICNKWEADLVVLGSVARTDTDHVGLGSTAKEVLGRVPCSVQLARAQW